MIARSDTRTELGATAIVVATWMFLLMGFAAIAIDLGTGFNERRSDQNAADTAVLAGAVELVLGGSTQDAVDQIVAYVDTNLRPTSIAEWEACTDPDQLATATAQTLGLTPATPCISFFKLEEIRVRVPNQQTDTSFGRFLGFDSLTTHAAAESLAIQFPGEGAGPPFVALNGVGGGDQICLRTSSSGPTLPFQMQGNGPGVPASMGTNPDPCDETVYDPNSDFFGTLDPYAYFNPVTGALTCTSNLVDYAIAAGIDHPIWYFEPAFQVGVTNPTGPSVVEEDCNPNPISGVNTMKLKTGLTAPLLRCGMLTTGGGVCNSTVPGPGGTSVPARLHTGPYVQNTYTFLTERMDNSPLWDFFADLNAANVDVPAACVNLYNNRATPSWDYFDKKDELISCLSSWTPTAVPTKTSVLFSDDLILTPRFAWIPYLAEQNLNTEPSACPSSAAAQCVHFNDFAPVYLQTLYSVFQGGQNRYDCDPGGNSPRWGRHDAGQAEDCGRNNDQLDRLAALVIDCGMLPEDLCEARPGLTPGGDVTPIIELTK